MPIERLGRRLVQTELSHEIRREPIRRIAVGHIGQQRQRLGFTSGVHQEKPERVAGAASQRRCCEQVAEKRLRPGLVAIALAIHQGDGQVQARFGPIGRRGLDGGERVNRGVEVELPHQTDGPVVSAQPVPA